MTSMSFQLRLKINGECCKKKLTNCRYDSLNESEWTNKLVYWWGNTRTQSAISICLIPEIFPSHAFSSALLLHILTSFTPFKEQFFEEQLTYNTYIENRLSTMISLLQSNHTFYTVKIAFLLIDANMLKFLTENSGNNFSLPF